MIKNLQRLRKAQLIVLTYPNQLNVNPELIATGAVSFTDDSTTIIAAHSPVGATNALGDASSSGLAINCIRTTSDDGAVGSNNRDRLTINNLLFVGATYHVDVLHRHSDALGSSRSKVAIGAVDSDEVLEDASPSWFITSFDFTANSTTLRFEEHVRQVIEANMQWVDYKVSIKMLGIFNHFEDNAAKAGSSSTSTGTWTNTTNTTIALESTNTTDGANAISFTNVGGGDFSNRFTVGGFKIGDTFNVYFDVKANLNEGAYAGNFEVTVRNPSTAAKLATTGVFSSSTYGAAFQSFHLTGTLETTELGLWVSMTSSGDIGDSCVLDNVRIYINQSE